MGDRFYDIAIVETEPLYDPGFIPVCLNEDDSTLLGNRGILLSYVSQKIEQKTAELPVVNKKYCANKTNPIPDHSFCINQGNNNGWICHGKSAGSFMIREGERWYLRGVVSTVNVDPNKDCKRQTVSLTNVAQFYEFIIKSRQVPIYAQTTQFTFEGR